MWTIAEGLVDGGRNWDDLYSEQERARYTSYLGERTVSSAAAILFVDFYKGAADYQGTDPDTAAFTRRRQSAVQVAALLRDHFYDRGMPVYYSTNESQAVRRLFPVTQRNHGGEFDPVDAYRIVPELAPREGDSLVVKARASAFFGTCLDVSLRLADVSTLVIAGQSTSGCVRATAVDSFSLCFGTIVVEDAVYDRARVSHVSSLFDIHHKYGTVLTAADLVSVMQASDPE